jgi:hypothetical protein
MKRNSVRNRPTPSASTPLAWTASGQLDVGEDLHRLAVEGGGGWT